MKKLVITAIAAASLLALGVASAQAQNLAVVNGKPIPTARMDTFLQQAARSGKPVTDDIKRQIKDEVITREVFVQEAQKLGMDATEDFKLQMELARQSILIRELLTQYQSNNPVSDADIKAEYDKFVAENGGKEYHARHILVETEAEAKAIIAQLKKGGKFDVIAKKSSKDPGSGANGGDLDWANPRSYVKEFSDTLIALKKGQTTDAPVKTQFGYHIIRLEDVRDAKLPALDEIKPQIAQKLGQIKIDSFRKELLAKSKIE
ncbi:MAG: peptidylprolyl isomerase [Betaproteobacteria bacterium]